MSGLDGVPSMVMQIGGVRYWITHEAGWPEPEWDAVRKRFVTQDSPGQDTVDVMIHVGEGSLPDTRGMDLMFHTGKAWAMYRGGDSRCMVYHPPGYDRMFWAAVFDPDGRRVSVRVNGKAGGHSFPPMAHPLDQMILMQALAGENGVLLHGSAVDIGGKGVVFAGQSGSGKSTLGRLFTESGRGDALSDERVVIRPAASGLRVYGTPWHSDACLAAAKDLPLSALFFIHHGPELTIVPCDRSMALKRLLPLVSIPWYDQDGLSSFLDFCGRIITTIPVYDLLFRPEQNAVEAISRFVCGRRTDDGIR